MDDFTFELRESAKPWTLAEISAFVERVKKLKQRIPCSPDAFERIDRLVRNEGYGVLYKVIRCEWLEPSQAFIMQSEANKEADLQRILDQIGVDLVERARRDSEDWLERERRKAQLLEHQRPGWIVGPPPPFGIISRP